MTIAFVVWVLTMIGLAESKNKWARGTAGALLLIPVAFMAAGYFLGIRWS